MASKAVHALVLRLVAAGSLRLRSNMGRLVHGAFLDVVRDLDPALAEQLHSANERKPYTTSPIWAEDTVIQRGDTAYVRFAFLDPTLTELFVERFLLDGTNHQLRLGQTRFAIAQVYATSTGHARAGKLCIVRDPKLPLYEEVEVHFLTPTTFSRKQGRKITYSIDMSARHVWHYPRRIWGMIGGDDPGQVFDQWCEQHVMMTSTSLTTHRLDFKRFHVPGVVGHTSYKLTNVTYGEPFHQLWCYLATFMPFSSIGYKTTMGMGQCTIHVP